MPDEPHDLTLDILKDIQARLGRMEDRLAATDERLGRLEDVQRQHIDLTREIALRTTLVEVRAGGLQTAIDRIEADIAAIKRHTGLVDA